MSSHHDEPPRKIVEDSPTMRSVALAAPPLMPSMRSLTPMKMPLTSAVYEVVDSSPKLQHGTKTKQSSSSSSDFSEVTRFPAFPTGYFLERTHVRIHDGTTTPEEVWSRVSAILSHESVATRYDTKEVQIACESVDHVEFMVRFFQMDDECLVVEAQRLCGCSFSFHQLAKCVLRSAKGLPPSSAVKAPLALPKGIPRTSEQDQLACVKEGIEIAVTLMQQGTLDAQLMALESLAQISQACKDGSAAEIILGNTEMLHILLSFLQTNDSHSNTVDCQLHRAAMTVVANCLDGMQTNSKLDQALKAHGDSLLSDRILASLLSEVAACEQKPHEACEAIRVLQVLTQASAETKQRIEAHDAQVLVVRAAAHQDSFHHRHARLGQLSQQFLRTWEH